MRKKKYFFLQKNPRKMSGCPLCLVEPTSHSFTNIGNVGNVSIIYSRPADAVQYKETPESFLYYSGHLGEMKETEWIWIVDSSDMKLKHACSLGLTKKLVHILQEEHGPKFKKVIILNPTSWMHACITMIKPFLKKTLLEKIHMMNSSVGALELYSILKEFGPVDNTIVKQIMR